MLHSKIKPMLSIKTDKPFDSLEYLFEPKYDGIRFILQCCFKKGKIELYTKPGNRITKQFPEFQDIRLPGVKDIILDGELIILTGGRPDFAKVMKRFSSGHEKAKVLVGQLPATMAVFDVLYLNGQSVTEMPLLYRKKLIEDHVPDSELLVKSMYVENNGVMLFSKIVESSLEGIIAKPKQSKYYQGQRKLWQKIKNYYYDEMDVLGYVFGTGRLLVGKNGVPVAQALGLPPADRKALVKLLPEISTKRAGDTAFVEPGIRCQVKYTVGATGGMRECVFSGWAV